MNIHNKTISEVQALLHEHETVSEQLLEAMKKDSRIGIQKLLARYYQEQEAIRKRKEKAKQLLTEERRLWALGYSFIGGIDEAGRGPLAGPVAAACVILPRDLTIEGIDDSKKLTAAKREELYKIIYEKALAVGLGIVDQNKIDEINIYNATVLAMNQAVRACSLEPDYLLLDAMHLKDMPVPQLSIIGGDGKSQSIAAASIIAKVTRDKIMDDLAGIYPEYGFDKHKGYGTEEHIAAIRKYGISPVHRKSFLAKIL